MKRKVFGASLAAVLTASIVFAGFAPATLTGAAASPKVSIVVWTNLENETKTLQSYAQAWSKKTGNSATVIHQTPDVQKFAQAVKSADGPDAVYGIANDQLSNYVAAGLVQKVPGNVFKESDYVRASVRACYSNGKKYAVPIAVETTALFYNTQKIKKAPATWDELFTQAKANGGIKFDATSIYYDLGFLRAYHSYIFQYSNGTYKVSDIGLGDKNAVKGYTYIKKFANAGFFSSDVTSDLAKSSFQSGSSAFYIGGPWDVDGLKAAGTPFSVAPMPKLNNRKFVTPVGTQVGFVSAKSKKQSAVWSFYEYLMKNSNKSMYAAGGRIPALLSAQKSIKVDSNTKAFITQISYGEPLPTVPELGQVWTPYSDNMKLMLNGTITPAKAAQNIDKQVRDGIALMNSGK